MKKSKKITKSEFQFFNLYEEAINSPKFVDFEKLIASVLLVSNLGFETPEYKLFEQIFQEAFSKKFDILFDFFILHFDKNLKFSDDALVPTITFVEDSNVETFNLKNSVNPKMNLFLEKYNQMIHKLLTVGHFLEILPKVVIYISEHTKNIKILFDKQSVLYKG